MYTIHRLFACRHQWHMVSKTLHQQNPPVLSWRCWLKHVTCIVAIKWWLLVNWLSWLPSRFKVVQNFVLLHFLSDYDSGMYH